MSSPTASTLNGEPVGSDAEDPGKPRFVEPSAPDPTTPTDGKLRIAALRLRAVGFVIDVAVFALITVAGVFLAVAIASGIKGAAQPNYSDGARHAVVLVRTIGSSIAALIGVWFVWVRTPTRDADRLGQTFGGRAMSVRIVDRDGTALTKSRAARRVALPGAMIALAGPTLLAVGIRTDFSDTAFNHGYAMYALTAIALGIISLPLRLLGGRRATLNDRLGGTVIVEASPNDPMPRPGDAPYLIDDRSKTASTYALTVLTLLVCAGLLAGALPEAFKDLRDRGTSSGLNFDATTKSGAQRKTTIVAKAVAACIETQGGVSGCDTEDNLDLPKGLTLSGFFDTAPGSTVVVSKDDSEVVVGTLDDTHKLWAIAQSEDGTSIKACLDAEGEQLCGGTVGW